MNSLAKLDRSEKLAAAAYVLSRPDFPIPAPPTARDLLELGADDLRRALQRFQDREPHRFANLFGAIGGTSGGAIGAAFGRVLEDRGAWTATLLGAVIGTYPPAIFGAAIDRVID